MDPLPLFERARAQAEARPREALDLETLEGLRRAVEEIFDDGATLVAKILADGRVDVGERRLVDDALARLARYYEVALGFSADGALEAPHRRVLAALEEAGRALESAGAGDRVAAITAFDEARAHLAEARPAGLTSQPDPAPLHAAAERVYDRTTGRSKYDPRDEGWLTFQLRCPRDACGQPADYRLRPGRPTHALRCPACGAPFTAYVATVVRSAHELGQGLVSHEVRTRDQDRTERLLRFEEVAQPPGLRLEPKDLVVVSYDEDNRLRLVRNYSRGGEVWVAPRSRCFVATAALGPFSPEVVALRRLRDEVLLARIWGRAFVAVYEVVGPPAAGWVARRRWRRRVVGAMVRGLARPLEGAFARRG